MQSDKWQNHIDRALQNAREEGKLNNLPGEGKPLKLDDDTQTPEHLRMAHKLLKDHGFAPEWIMHGQEIDSKKHQLVQSMKKAVRAYKGTLGDAERDPAADAETRRLRAHSTWKLAKQNFEEAARKLNKEILSYNLKVPNGVTHKALLNVERELEQLLQ